jgi:hypothetical protein
MTSFTGSMCVSGKFCSDSWFASDENNLTKYDNHLMDMDIHLIFCLINNAAIIKKDDAKLDLIRLWVTAADSAKFSKESIKIKVADLNEFIDKVKFKSENILCRAIGLIIKFFNNEENSEVKITGNISENSRTEIMRLIDQELGKRVKPENKN